MEYINAIKYQPTGINGTLLKNQKSKEENKVLKSATIIQYTIKGRFMNR